LKKNNSSRNYNFEQYRNRSYYKNQTISSMGGRKKWLTKQIEDFLPQQFNSYYEPFLGGGAIFLHLKKIF